MGHRPAQPAKAGIPTINIGMSTPKIAQGSGHGTSALRNEAAATGNDDMRLEIEKLDIQLTTPNGSEGEMGCRCCRFALLALLPRRHSWLPLACFWLLLLLLLLLLCTEELPRRGISPTGCADKVIQKNEKNVEQKQCSPRGELKTETATATVTVN